jgi:hypothetical protein
VRSPTLAPSPYRDDPVFQDARLQPFLDQADDAPVADPVLNDRMSASTMKLTFLP